MHQHTFLGKKSQSETPSLQLHRICMKSLALNDPFPEGTLEAKHSLHIMRKVPRLLQALPQLMWPRPDALTPLGLHGVVTTWHIVGVHVALRDLH